MTNFECCKTKQFPCNYYICINCLRVYHRSCVQRDKSKYTFVDGYKIKCCVNQTASEELSQEKSILEETLSEMLENSLLKDQHINKLQQEHNKFLSEVQQREDELNAFIRSQEATLQKAQDEIEQLKNDILLLTKKSFSTHATQTSNNNYTSKKTQTEPNCELEKISEKTNGTPSNKTRPASNSSRSKLILVSGNHGRYLVHFLSEYLDDFSVSSIMKPNAFEHDLIQTAIVSSKNLTKNDVIIVWPEENCNHLFNQLNNNLGHTNFFILTTPDRYDYPNMNEKIYYSNLALFKEAHSVSGNLNSLINVNSILRRTNNSPTVQIKWRRI